MLAHALEGTGRAPTPGCGALAARVRTPALPQAPPGVQEGSTSGADALSAQGSQSMGGSRQGSLGWARRSNEGSGGGRFKGMFSCFTPRPSQLPTQE